MKRCFGCCAAILLGITTSILPSGPAGAELLLTISPGLDGGPPRPADPTLRTIDTADGSTVASVTITMAGFTVQGGTGLARDPLTGDLYAMLKAQGTQNPFLVILDEVTGDAQLIGGTSDRFAGIAFTSTGALYGVSGDGGVIPEALYSIDPLTANSTLLGELGAGSDGETLAFNPDDGLLYHASGIGNQNQANGEEFETIGVPPSCSGNPPACVTSTVTLSGDDYEELTGLTYVNGGFFGADLGDAGMDIPSLYEITTTGAVTFIGSMDHVAKGLALRVEPLPSPTPTPPPTSTPTATATPTPTPEPSALLVVAAGAAVLGLLNRRRRTRPGK